MNEADMSMSKYPQKMWKSAILPAKVATFAGCLQDRGTPDAY